MTADLYADFPPAAPQNLTLPTRTNDGQHPNLQWDANSEPDIDHYAIYRGYQDSKTDPINWNSTPSGTTSNTTWTDPFVTISGSANSRVNYRVTAVDSASNESGYSNSQYVNSFQVPKAFREKGEVAQALPTEFKLYGNYPNPFNPETTIRLELPTPAKVVLTVFSITGAEVRTLKRGALAAGYHTFSWDGKDERGSQLPSGVYFYRFEAKTAVAGQAVFVKSGKMTLLR